jgi:hypothetical protein
MPPYTLYKARGVSTKQQVCAICVERTRGRTTNLQLPYGVSVWLCADHASKEFVTMRGGRDFVLTLHRPWQAHGCMTKRRSKALDAMLASGRTRRARARPGSYSWPRLRTEAEGLFARGVPVRRVIAELRKRHAQDYARAPSVRTMQRWFGQRRWEDPLPRDPPVVSVSPPVRS